MKTAGWILIFNFIFIRGFCQSAEKRIDSLMSTYYRPDFPGAVICIEQNNETVFKKSYGIADLQTGEPLSPDVNFNIGSLTKQFTAFAVLDLYFQGKFSLSDSIGKFFKISSGISSIPIGQLLNHSSGIPDHYNFVDTNLIKHATDKDVMTAMQRADTPYFPSGTRYRYSNTAYCLLGMLIEKISGMSYGDYLQKNIFSPLGIRNASVFKMNRNIPDRVFGYDLSYHGNFVKSDADESIFFSTEADGGIYISMNNYMKWCRAIESGKFSATHMIQREWTEQTLVDSVRGLWYGNGWFIQSSTAGRKIFYHTGFNGGFRTVVLMIPSISYCISLFSNRSDIDLENIVSQIDFILSVSDNSFIKSGPLESFIHSWPIFAPCKETSLFSTSFRKNLNAKGMELN